MSKTIGAEVSRIVIRTYVVEDDHAILYAGQDLTKARAVIRGSSTMDVWEDDLWLGSLRYDGVWTFKTKHHPDNAPQPAAAEEK